MQVEEHKRLAELVVLINDSIKCFYNIGCALREIRDKRLYRELNDTFEQYCTSHLSIGRAYVYRQIAAADVIDNLSPNGDIPLNEAQTRPLTKLKPKEQKLAWKYATDMAKAEGRKVCSFDVIKAVCLIKNKNDPRENRGALEKNNNLKNIDVVGMEFKKAYGIFFEAIKNAMDSDWETTSKDAVISRLSALIKFLKTH